jgi:hypothetical protein
MRAHSLAAAGTAAALLLSPGLARRAAAQAPEVSQADHHDTSPVLRTLPRGAPRGGAPAEHPVRRLPPLPAARGPLARDPVVQASPGPALTLEVKSFEGLGHPDYAVAAAPADTTGAAGDTQYVQWVNTAFAVFDKADGRVLLPATDGRALWAGFGGKCEDENDGDPIVLYDRLAGRWLLTQFAVKGGPPYFECVAVSTTSDATGTYARYSYRFSDFNDYPKFGVWPDGYYATFNMFRGDDFVGSKVCAYERDRMLAGDPARMVCFSVRQAGLLPADLDGRTPPPAGEPNYVLNFGRDRLNLWRFHVDWSDPTRSQLDGPQAVDVAAFEPACASGAPCIAQPGSTRLDSLGDRLMFRLGYRNLGAQQALVVNHSVVADAAAGTVGVRWYEIRDPGGSPEVSQQGTFAPDKAHRWMGSVAMDKAGNIAAGYSVSSKNLSPSIRVSGRRPGDPAGTLGQEAVVVAGSGRQAQTRWGDYATLTLDPSDDCRFWFSTQYLAGTGNFRWHTRVASFRMPGCQ